MNVHILALETSSSLCGAALLSRTAAGQDIRVLTHDATGEHAERLLPMVDELLQQAGIARRELDAVAFGQGPGGFTGLRVACGVAQGIAFALGLPVIPVVSLLAVAARDHAQPTTSRDAIRVVAQDARMGEVYLAAYEPVMVGDAVSWQELQEPILLDAEDVRHWLEEARATWRIHHGSAFTIRIAGDALTAHPHVARGVMQVAGVQLGDDLRPDAPTIAQLAQSAWEKGAWLTPDLAAPLYVRDKVAYTTRERQQGLAGNPKAQAVVTLHPMTADHLDEVAAIEGQVQAFPWSRRNFQDGLQAGYPAWVARQDDRIIGFCMLMFAPDLAHLLVIAVAPARQKKGAGSMLLQLCEREAQARDLPALMLEVRPSNVNAVQFYKAHGFEVAGVRKDYYPARHGEREDAWVMKKTLPAAQGQA